MTTLAVYVPASPDDGYWSEGGALYATSSLLAFGLSSWNTYLRFPVAIGGGASVSSCVLRVRAMNTDSAECSALIACVDGDDVSAPTTLAQAEALETQKTEAGVSWEGIEAFSTAQLYYTPDLSSPVAEVLARPGWSSGNHIMFLLLAVGSAGFRRLTSVDYYPTGTQLTVEYTEGGGGGGIAHRVIGSGIINARSIVRGAA